MVAVISDEKQAGLQCKPLPLRPVDCSLYWMSGYHRLPLRGWATDWTGKSDKPSASGAQSLRPSGLCPLLRSIRLADKLPRPVGPLTRVTPVTGRPADPL